jgi:hypothetical protein
VLCVVMVVSQKKQSNKHSSSSSSVWIGKRINPYWQINQTCAKKDLGDIGLSLLLFVFTSSKLRLPWK